MYVPVDEGFVEIQNRVTHTLIQAHAFTYLKRNVNLVLVLSIFTIPWAKTHRIMTVTCIWSKRLRSDAFTHVSFRLTPHSRPTSMKDACISQDRDDHWPTTTPCTADNMLLVADVTPRNTYHLGTGMSGRCRSIFIMIDMIKYFRLFST